MVGIPPDLPAGAEMARLAKLACLDTSNPAGGNQIHSDDFAHQMGFEAALVPGPTLMAYMTELLISVYGEAWFESGTLNLRFRRPVYDQEEVLAKALFRERRGGVVALDVTLEKGEGEVAVTGEATCTFKVVGVTQRDKLPTITPDAVAVGQDLGALEHLFTLEDVMGYAAEVANSSTWFEPHGDQPTRVHPTMLSTVGLRLLRQSFETEAVILTGQEEAYYGTAWTGQRLVTSGKISDKGQRRGREFIEIKTSTSDEAGRELVRRRTTVYLTVEKSV